MVAFETLESALVLQRALVEVALMDLATGASYDS